MLCQIHRSKELMKQYDKGSTAKILIGGASVTQNYFFDSSLTPPTLIRIRLSFKVCTP